MYAFIHIYIYMYTHTYTHIHTHAHTHTHTHTRTHARAYTRPVAVGLAYLRANFELKSGVHTRCKSRPCNLCFPTKARGVVRKK